MQTLGNYPGLPGMFVAGIFSGALSTVSSGLNSLAAITLEDFIVALFFKNMSDKTKAHVSRGLALGYGLLCFGLVFVAEKLGDVLQAALSIFGMIGGPLLGLFTLGMFVPWSNSKGAISGMLTSLAFTFWIGFGAQFNKQALAPQKAPLSVEGCILPVNVTTPSGPRPDPDDVLDLYKLSYMFYSAVGCGVVILVGTVVSFLTKPQDPRDLDPRLIADVPRYLLCCLPRGFSKMFRCHVGETYNDTEELPEKADSKANGYQMDNIAFKASSDRLGNIEYNTHL